MSQTPGAPESAAAPETPATPEPDPTPHPVPEPDAAARAAVVERLASLISPPGGLGLLGELAGWLAEMQGTCPPRPPERARIVVVAADHGIAAAGVSAHGPEDTARQVAAVLEQTAPVTVVAAAAGATVRVVDAGLDREPLPGQERHRVRRGSGRLDREDALTSEEVEAGLRIGRELADQEIDSGADLLVPAALGVGGTTPAAALVAVLTGTEPVAVVGRGSGIDDTTWMRKTAAVRDGLRRARPHVRDPKALLQTVGGADLAVLTGLLAQAAHRRTPVLLDGLVAGAAALLAEDLAPGARRWWLAAQQSGEPAMTLVLKRLQLTPVLDLRIAHADGTAPAALLPLLRSAALLLGASPTG